ncbi:MAG: hypothetical protein L0229_00280 [Blastocatellia bacterium]|nr:hypothetical protein [Blastocatellia bacterium]
MMRFKMLATSLSITFALIASLIPEAALAGDAKDDRPIKLHATAMEGPIGKVASFGEVVVDGRAIYGERSIWGGQMVQAKAASARIRFDSIGEVTLAGGAMARFAAVRNEEASGKVLIAQLVAGDIAVRLNDGAGAYAEARGSVFTASRGAEFRLRIREGEVLLDKTEGEVVEQQDQQRKYIIRPVGLGANISVRARETRQIQMRVTDENDNPVPDIPVIFLLGNPGAGSFGSGAAAASSVTVTTNAQGIATTSFTAGPGAGSSSMTATVSGTNASWTGSIGISAAAAGGLSATTIAIIAAAAAAGATVAVVATKSDEPRPITVSPPVVRP